MINISKRLQGFLIAMIFCGFSAGAQNAGISLKSGMYHIPETIETAIANSELVNGNYYRIIQFNSIPSTEQKEEMRNKGIRLLNYIPNKAYLAEIKATANLQVLNNYDVRALGQIKKEYKLSKKLFAKNYEDWALFGSNIRLNTIYFDGLSRDDVTAMLKGIGAKVIVFSNNNVARIEIAIALLSQLYEQPYLYYFEQIDAPGEPENLVGVTNHRSNNIATAYTSGLHYDGTGVTVMLQDNSKLDEHIDYTGRFTDINATQSGDHGEHCGGTIAGAGNLDPTARGMAYGADVMVYDADNLNYNDVPTIYANNNVTITSKSYSNGVNAGYTSLAQQLDQQVRTLPSLIHVFSAGNSNGSGSTAAGTDWFNITGGHKAGKNVITCANLTDVDVVSNSSSRGPCEDGRIKPDISAVGTNVYSTNDPNNYVYKSGTSMSCPGVSGTLAQLYHAYKDLNGGVNPPSGLIKAAVLNTADDIGNPGPDFIHGWGRINARRAYDLISNNNYISSTISQGGSNVHNITVPAGTDQLRVMVLWMDYEGAVSASPALVNDINMTLTDPGSTPYNPWVLDPTPNATTLALPAVRGVDNLNNMEQVTLDNPVAGTYTVDVSGFAIPQGPQTYYVVYEFVTDDVVLTYPIGGEGFDPNVDEKIRWDALGNAGTFTLEYSINNGVTWSIIASGINGVDRSYDWNVPATVTGQALVRVTRGASTSQSHEPFSIIEVPTGLTVNWACPDSMEVAWNAVAGATGYEVSLLGAKYMDFAGTGTGTSLVIAAPSNVDHWWSVKALGPNNCRGRRAIAQFQSSGTYNCAIAIDAGIAEIGPVNNSIVSSCMAPNVVVNIDISNQGTSPISNIPVHYTVNGGAAVNEVYTGTINPGGSFTYTFTTPITPTLGTSNLVIWNDLAGDGNMYNDTIWSQYTYINSTAQTIPWSDNFESFSLCATTTNCDVEVCSLGNEFINEANGSVDDIDWRTDRGGTPSGSTGPSTDFNPGTSVGKYLYLEASGGCDGMAANLVSPCIDLTNATAAQLDFAYHMRGVDMGSLHVDIYMNGVWTNDITTPISGDQGNNWFNLSVPLTSYLGNVVNFRIRGITGTGYRSDMAIDDVSVTGTVSVEEQLLSGDFSIHPNPSNGIFNYDYQGNANANVKVMAVNGKVVYQKVIEPAQNGVIDMTDLAKGLYILVINSEGDVITKKLIKE